MKKATTERLVQWFLACTLWLGLGFSLGWYYTFTYYGRSGWPMPTPEPCAALVLYYFSVLNLATEIQAVHWMLVFPLSGVLWAFALWFTAPRFRAAPPAPRPAFSRLHLHLAVAALPMIVPGPVMACMAARTATGFSFGHMIDVALRHSTYAPPVWLTPLYFTLGLCALAWQVRVYYRTFRPAPGNPWLHFFASAILLVLLACLLGAAVGFALAPWQA